VPLTEGKVDNDEENIPAKEKKNEKGAWLFEKNAHKKRSERDQKATLEGP